MSPAPRSGHRVVLGLGLAGAALGVVVGLLELTIGADIRSWVGDKSDTTRLGLVTLILALIALATALWLWSTPKRTPAVVLTGATGLLLPGLVCFTTAGRLWYLPGLLLVAGGAGLLASAGHPPRELAGSLGRGWLRILTAVLAVLYILLGAVALGITGVLAMAGGALVLATLAIGRRIPVGVATALVVAGAVPFAVLAWWSVVAPLAGVLLVVLGIAAVRGAAAGDRQPVAV
ncbi:MAG: hypothetical protein MUE51_10545 [Thermoleophilia bacterium]|jgi:hypothetical protein|nr:hypothetical protein [Thermoleophilia bacterium]